MSYEVNGQEFATDEEGYLLEANDDGDVAAVIAAQEGIALTQDHWTVIEYLRSHFREHGQTPNFRHMLKELQEIMPGSSSQSLYELFPIGPAKQAVKIAGLPKPFGKGGY